MPSSPSELPPRCLLRSEVDLIDALAAADGDIARAAGSSGKPRRAFLELMRKRGVVVRR